jgi:hypothetical protein
LSVLIIVISICTQICPIILFLPWTWVLGFRVYKFVLKNLNLRCSSHYGLMDQGAQFPSQLRLNLVACRSWR